MSEKKHTVFVRFIAVHIHTFTDFERRSIISRSDNKFFAFHIRNDNQPRFFVFSDIVVRLGIITNTEVFLQKRNNSVQRSGKTAADKNIIILDLETVTLRSKFFSKVILFGKTCFTYTDIITFDITFVFIKSVGTG